MKTRLTTVIAEKLMATRGYPLISMYMPTHRAGAEIPDGLTVAAVARF